MAAVPQPSSPRHRQKPSPSLQKLPLPKMPQNHSQKHLRNLPRNRTPPRIRTRRATALIPGTRMVLWKRRQRKRRNRLAREAILLVGRVPAISPLTDKAPVISLPAGRVPAVSLLPAGRVPAISLPAGRIPTASPVTVSRWAVWKLRDRTRSHLPSPGQAPRALPREAGWIPAMER